MKINFISSRNVSLVLFYMIFNKRKLWQCNETMKIATIQLNPRFCHAFSTEKYTISYKLNVFQSNQITFVTSSQHMCLDEWNSWERAPDSAETINI